MTDPKIKEAEPTNAPIEEAAVIEVEPTAAMKLWGTDHELALMTERFRSLVPGMDDLNDEQCTAVAQYAGSMGLNPFAGEIYAWVDKDGKFHMQEGYRAWTRWANEKEPYTATFRDLEAGKGNLGQKCYVMKRSDRDSYIRMVEGGTPWEIAFDLCTTEAVGVVYKEETSRRPPHGWTWNQVARKRALKSCLKISHGQPSVHEMRRHALMVEGVSTQTDDWTLLEGTYNERAATAKYNANARTRPEGSGDAAQAMAELYGDEAADAWRAKISDVGDEVVQAEFEPVAITPPPYPHATVKMTFGKHGPKREGGALSLWQIEKDSWRPKDGTSYLDWIVANVEPGDDPRYAEERQTLVNAAQAIIDHRGAQEKPATQEQKDRIEDRIAELTGSDDVDSSLTKRGHPNLIEMTEPYATELIAALDKLVNEKAGE